MFDSHKSESTLCAVNNEGLSVFVCVYDNTVLIIKT